mgnify:CR=1 FL=1
MKRIPPINCLETFDVLARVRSMKKAAEVLCVSPSAVSHRIRLMEKILERSLFDGVDFSLSSESVQYLKVVRESLVHEGSDGEEWTSNSDVAIVLHLAKGNLILRLLSHSVEAIAVEFALEFNVSTFEKPSSRFENDLFDAYSSKCELVTVS